MNWVCRVCKEPMSPTMCMSGVVEGGTSWFAHVGCADEFNNEEIDVFKVSISDGGSYYEKSIETVADMLRDADQGSEYIVKKERMVRAKYESLPEFTGF